MEFGVPCAMKGTDQAPEGQIYICAACGKTSPTQYGFDENNKKVSDYGWDESCMLHAVLVYTDSIMLQGARVIKAIAVPEIEKAPPPPEGDSGAKSRLDG